MPVLVNETVYINNAYEAILKEEKLGNLIIKRYGTLENEEEVKIQKGRIRSIHMLGLLNPKDKQSECMAKFIKEKFPNEWEIAIRNTEEEIKEMIN